MTEVIRVFDRACDNQAGKLFEELESENPLQLRCAVAPPCELDVPGRAHARKHHGHHRGDPAANRLQRRHGRLRELAPRQFPPSGAQTMRAVRHHRRHGRQLAPADQPFRAPSVLDPVRRGRPNTPDGRLTVHVRFMLDDFANPNVANFDNMLSVIRSREISCTVVCQTVSQLEARYGKPAANSIIGNCDHQLVLGFQDEETARYFSLRANKPAASLLATPARRWWLFERGCPAICDDAYRLEQHPRFAELATSERGEADASFASPQKRNLRGRMAGKRGRRRRWLRGDDARRPRNLRRLVGGIARGTIARKQNHRRRGAQFAPRT